MIWKQKPDLPALNAMLVNTMGETLGMEFTEAGDNYLVCRMPVDDRTVQPHRLLHGGASVALAETLGSVASVLCIAENEGKTVVGVEINANHLRPATKGFVYGKVVPVRIGRMLHVWNIEISDDKGRLVCVSRLTVAVVNRR